MINVKIMYFAIKISFIEKMTPSLSLGRLRKLIRIYNLGLNSNNIVIFLMMDTNLHFKLELEGEVNFQK